MVGPKTESNTEAPRSQSAKSQSAKLEQPATERASPAARRTTSWSSSEKPRRKRYWTEARIVRELHRHGIYW
jgi:hypothetical protein